jgi:cytochrome c553
MEQNAQEALRTQLKAEPPEGVVAELDDDELARLAAALHAARVEQAVALDAALRGALDHVPFFLRGAVKKIVFG